MMQIVKKIYGLVITVCFVVLFFSSHSSVLAQQNNSTDLSVTCVGDNSSGIDCAISPNNRPMFDAQNILPGDRFLQKLSAINDTSQNGSFAIRAENLRFVPFANPVLSDELELTIRENVANGPIVYGPKSITEFITDTTTNKFIFLSPVNSNQSRVYYFEVNFKPSAGNEYQGKEARFDLQFSYDFVPFNSDNSSNPQTSSGQTGSVAGVTSNSASECTAEIPSGVPTLSFIDSDTSDGQITLSWTPVSPVTTYAINFGTQAGVYQFGNNNIGNINTYQVGGLVPGFQYYFQVLGVNDCAPGTRSNEILTVGTPIGGAVVPAPIGFTEGQVLGEATDAAVVAQEVLIQPDGQFVQGEVLGASVCRDWKKHLPWILLLIQALLISIGYLLQRAPVFVFKQVGAILWTLGSIGLFYYFRECDCYQGGFLSWLCKWYFVPSLGLTLLLQSINYFWVEWEE